jgi:hypothetical protein
MRAGLRIGLGIALGAAALALGSCGGDAGGTTDQAGTTERPISRPPPPTVVARRLGPTRVEPGRQSLPARPCSTIGRDGTTTIPIFSESGPCARVSPGERLAFVNETGIGPRHAGAVTIRVSIGNYELRIAPQGKGLVRPPVETYLGRGSHRVRTAGAPGATVLLLPPDCAIRPPAEPGEELCFR